MLKSGRSGVGSLGTQRPWREFHRPVSCSDTGASGDGSLELQPPTWSSGSARRRRPPSERARGGGVGLSEKPDGGVYPPERLVGVTVSEKPDGGVYPPDRLVGVTSSENPAGGVYPRRPRGGGVSEIERPRVSAGPLGRAGRDCSPRRSVGVSSEERGSRA
ncbi:hypothetical protein Val02_76860 [Virgisporangium aliadipatigenens]|uniref:Uncharacterized protein n=1 Tax=Virgisporangium aliadipatigenens TaxID=741659 RepID=A0A8J4DU06_9ACTN|nr:hypothetical protein Val02_76860 [Virgisporangium aliadipatigenens]